MCSSNVIRRIRTDPHTHTHPYLFRLLVPPSSNRTTGTQSPGRYLPVIDDSLTQDRWGSVTLRRNVPGTDQPSKDGPFRRFVEHCRYVTCSKTPTNHVTVKTGRTDDEYPSSTLQVYGSLGCEVTESRKSPYGRIEQEILPSSTFYRKPKRPVICG